jgi:hypothetical protein
MPVGCIGPFAFFSIAPKSAQTPLFITALVLPFVGLAGTLLMFGDRSKCKRSLALAEQADRLGLRFVARPLPDEYRWLERTESFGAAEKHMGGVNRLAGPASGQDVWVIDYTCGVGGSGFRQTVLVLRGAVRGLPNFVVTPRSWLDKLGRMLGDRGVEVPGRPDVSKRFIVGSDDPEATGRCLSGGTADWLAEAGDMTVEVRDGDLIAQRYNQLVRPEDYSVAIERLRDLETRLRLGTDRQRSH